jgi:hypothetical protein
VLVFFLNVANVIGKMDFLFSLGLGPNTNNWVESYTFVTLLRIVVENGLDRLHVMRDSKLLINYMNGSMPFHSMSFQIFDRLNTLLLEELIDNHLLQTCLS